MTAFVLGAGLGTRLRPLTARRPKPLVPVGGRPLITYAFDHLISLGVTRFVVNTHWCAERYLEFFPGATYRSIPITFVHESPEALETAGGIWNAQEFLKDGPFVVYNGDILCSLRLPRALEQHRKSGCEVTLLLRTVGANRNVTFDEKSGAVLDLRRILRPELEPGCSFTGIYFVEPQFIARIPPGQIISVVSIFHEMIRAGAKVGGLICDDGDWRDLGTRDEYLAANALFPADDGNVIDPTTSIAPNAILKNCVVWEKARVGAGAKLTRCVIADGATAEGEHTDKDFV